MRSPLVLLLCAALLAPAATSQSPSLRFMFGVSTAWAHDDPPTLPPGVMSIPITSRPGLGLGVSYDLRLLGAVGMRPELRYAQRGWAHERQVRFDDPSVIARTETALDVMTIGVPARLRVGPATGWQASLLVGPEVALRVRCHATTTGASYGRATCDIPQLTRTISRAHVALIAALHADRGLRDALHHRAHQRSSRTAPPASTTALPICPSRISCHCSRGTRIRYRPRPWRRTT